MELFDISFLLFGEMSSVSEMKFDEHIVAPLLYLVWSHTHHTPPPPQGD